MQAAEDDIVGMFLRAWQCGDYESGFVAAFFTLYVGQRCDLHIFRSFFQRFPCPWAPSLRSGSFPCSLAPVLCSASAMSKGLTRQ